MKKKAWKRQSITWLLILTMALEVLTACGNSSRNGDGTSQNNPDAIDPPEEYLLSEYEDEKGYLKDDEIYVVGVEQLPFSQEEIYGQMFDRANKVELNVDISDAELSKIQQDYDKYANMGSKSPIYREAALYLTLTVDGEKYQYYLPHVGVRMKGNTSRTSFYNDHDGQYNLIHLRVKFTYGAFATLDSVELKWNRNDDSTYVREIYTYDMYRDMGVLAPRVTLASTDMAGEHLGVMSVYEPVDKNFIRRYVDKDDQGGDLYKCGWTNRGASLRTKCSYGVENEENCEFYNYDLKTNKKTSEHEQLRHLIEVLAADDVTKEDIAEVVDMDNFLRFAAISYFAGNPDDARYNYNNHYIYFLKSTGKAVFIPYDCDRVFGVTKTWNPTGNGSTQVDPYSTEAIGAKEQQKNPLFKYTTDRGGYYLEEYTDALLEIADCKWLTNEQFEGYFEQAKANYEDDTTPSKKFENAKRHKFFFKIDYSQGLGTDNGNACFAEYLRVKMQYFEQYVGKYE